MRRVAGVLAFALLVVGLGGSSGESVAVAKTPPTPPKSSAVLAIVGEYNGSRLAWLDPATLRPLKLRSVALPGGAWSPVFSPKGRYVALGGLSSVGIRIVDLRHMRVTARVAALRYSNRRLVPLAWPDRRRLLVLDSPQDALGARQRLLVVDPVARRAVAQLPAEGWWASWARAGRKLVVLMGSETGADPVHLAVHGPGGRVLGTVDVQMPGDEEPGSRAALPGFTVDATDDLAFMVGSETAARIDLETLEVSYLELSESRSLLSRVFAWLEPVAQAKLGHPPFFSRQATSLGNGLLAVSGSSFENARSTPSGLQFVDTRTGVLQTLEPRASAHTFSKGLLLAFGAGWNGATVNGMGLAAFSRDGTRLWSALGDEPVWLAETAAGYAYVPTPEESFPPGVRVIDLATGAVIRTVRGEMPTFVVRD